MYVRSSQSVNAIARQSVEQGAEAAAPRHFCQIQGCPVIIPRRHLMCREHWFQLPADMRDAVDNSLAAWLAGQASVWPYSIARLKALIYVNNLAGKPTEQLAAELAAKEAKQPCA
jgi:hypothetical protein